MHPRLESEPELGNKICALLEKGVPRVHACNQFGVAEKTFYNWINKYKESVSSGKEDNIYYQFGKAVKEAESKFIERNLQVIQVASLKSWQAAAWLLERRFAEDFGRKEKVINAKTFKEPTDELNDDQVKEALDLEKARIKRRERTKHFKAV